MIKNKCETSERNFAMKKKSLLLLTGLLLTVCITGCGSKEETNSTETSSEQGNIITGYLIDNADQYVTLASYEGLEVEKPIYEVTEDELNMEIENSLYERSELLEADRAAEMGDIVTVNLVATIEGETEPYINEEDYAIELGYEEFGTDFDAQLEGCKAGDSKTFSITFDEDTWYEEWIDKTVNFEVNVTLVEELIIPEYDEAFVKEQGYESIEEFEAYLKETLAAGYEEQSASEAKTNALLAAMDATEFQGYPDKLYDSCKTTVEEQYALFAETFGMSEEELYEAYEMTEEDVEAEILEAVNSRLFISAFCQKENLTVTEEEYQTFLEEQYYYYGYEDTAAFEEEYGKEYILWALYEDLTTSLLLEKANVTEVEYSYEDEAYEDETEEVEEIDGLDAVE